MFIIVEPRQGLIFPRQENYYQSLTHSVYYIHSSLTEAFILMHLQLNITTSLPESHFYFDDHKRHFVCTLRHYTSSQIVIF
jgi:hypothetical protein